MTKINTVGGYFREHILLDGNESPITGTDPVVVYGPNMDNLDGVSLQIAAEQTRSFMVIPGSDHVVSSTKTWTFADGNFGSGDVGGTFTIAGSVADDGTYTINSVTNATTVVSTEAVASNETFSKDVTVSITDPDLAATVGVEVSNDFVASKEPSLNQPPNPGHWTDISDAFSPAIGDISGEGSQFNQASPLVAKRLRVTITPSEGAAAVWVLFAGRGNR